MKKLIVLVMLFAGSVNAQVHRCTDAKTGKVTYSDTLCDTRQKSVFLEARKSEAELWEIQRLADEANERKYRERAIEQANQPTFQQSVKVDKSNSYECRLAQKNHNTTMSAGKQHIDNTNDSINKLNKACGSNVELATAPAKKQRPNIETEQEQEPKSNKPISMRCSNGMCHDDQNNRYFPNGDGILRGSNGTLCRSQGDRWNCN